MFTYPVQGGYAIVLAGGIVLAAFLSEDGATITAATLAASSMLDVRLAFLSAFTGLWVGDLLMYGLARRMGPTIVDHRWFKANFSDGSTVVKTGRTDNPLALALSRFVPGTRLPAYIAAGLDRMPIPVFALTTAISATAWIFLIFGTIHLIPVSSSEAQHQLTMLSVVGLTLFLGLTIWRRRRARTLAARSKADEAIADLPVMRSRKGGQ